MAEKRAFAATVLESDAFSDLSVSAKILYIFLNMAADDDGVCGKVKIASALAGIDNTQAALDELINAGYLIGTDDKQRVIITHWRVHNTIRLDMYKPTLYINDFTGITVFNSDFNF